MVGTFLAMRTLKVVSALGAVAGWFYLPIVVYAQNSWMRDNTRVLFLCHGYRKSEH
jgi:hypothetical protein